MDKVKVLITGSVNGAIPDLIQKLNTLQKSKAGPFDMCFCVGPFFSSSNDHADAARPLLKDKVSSLPLPVYFCDVGTLPAGIELPGPLEGDASLSKDEAEISLDDDSSEAKASVKTAQDNELPKGIICIAPNLYHLHGISTDRTQTADILNIVSPSDPKQYLTVAFLPPKSQMGSAQTAKLESKTNHASFIGVDLLLTSDWGQGLAASNCLSNDDQIKLGLKCDDATSGVSDAAKTIGSYDIAEVASQCRPRYHIAPSLLQPRLTSTPTADVSDETSMDAMTSFYVQSLPYTNPPSALASGVMKNYHFSRFLALCPVVDAKTQKINGKAKKYIHALGIQPLWSMDRVTATAVPDNMLVVPCPYTDEGYQKDMNGRQGAPGGDGNGVGTSANVNVGLSEAQTRRILSEDAGGGQDYRWNIRNRKRPLQQQVDPRASTAVDPNNFTLFLHGLQNDVSGGMNLNRGSILQAFQDKGCIRVRYPYINGHPNYCFLDFGTHDEAKKCLEESGGVQEVLGIHLTMKWSSGARRGGQGGPPPPPPQGHVGIYNQNGQPLAKRNKTRLTESEAADSSSLFVHLNLNTTLEELCSRGLQHVGKFAQKMLEDAINADGGEERVTANEEPALKVSARPLFGKQNCGFLDFASHAAASMALATMTGSTDGGALQQDLAAEDEDLKDALRDVQLWWARPKETSASNHSADRHGFRFRSQHFPPDARTDCWFCLASPTCERHLIVSVSDTCYITMPKGPVNKHHALIVPVNHSALEGDSKRPILGAFLDPTPGAIEDLEQAKERLRKYANEDLDKDLFVFERAIPTRGGYHAHINCIPVDRGLGSKIRTNILSLAAATNRGSGFQLRELQNPDIGIASILKNADEDELLGYFYAEVPFGNNGEVKRFLYTALDEGNSGRNIVPLQFGREVLASVLDDENLAHWKSCVLSTEIEEEYTESFRKAFAKFE